MNHWYFSFFLFSIIVSCKNNNSANKTIEKDEILLPPKNTFNQNYNRKFQGLFNIEIIDSIILFDNKWLIFKANNCLNCDNGKNVYMAKNNSFEFKEVGISSKIYRYNTDSLIYEGTIYYGNCVHFTNCFASVLFIERFLDANGNWNQEVILYKIDSLLHEEIIYNNNYTTCLSDSVNFKKIPIEIEYDLPE